MSCYVPFSTIYFMSIDNVARYPILKRRDLCKNLLMPNFPHSLNYADLPHSGSHEGVCNYRKETNHKTIQQLVVGIFKRMVAGNRTRTLRARLLIVQLGLQFKACMIFSASAQTRCTRPSN